MNHKVIAFITVCLLSLSLQGFSQISNLSGAIADETGQALPSSTIVLLNPSDSTMLYFGISDAQGNWEIKSVKSGNYLLQFAFLGFETAYRKVQMPNPDGEYWGIMAMKPQPVNLEGVQVIGDYVPMQIKKDTIEFNARAFKTKPDAVVEDLLKKLPGIQVDRAGNIKAMGEDVKKVLVDGKEFFGNDPKVATKNLPAGSLEKVQVYDKKSDEAEFTGIDDGSRTKALNLVLKEDQKDGVFGHVQGGYGTDNHYQGNAKLYRFTDKIQAAGLAMQNNINQFGFSFQDYIDFNGGMGALMSGGSAKIKIESDGGTPINFGQPVSGLTTSGAGGANFSYSWNKKRRVFFSYMGNGTDKDLLRNTKTTNFLEDGSYYQESDLIETKRDTTHSINFGVRYELDSTQSFFLDGGGSLTFSNAWGQTLTNSFIDDVKLNYLDRQNNQGGENGSLNARTSWIRKFGGNKTVLKISASGNVSRYESRFDWNNKSWFSPNPVESREAFFQSSTQENKGYSGNLSLTQKIGKKYYLTPQLKVSSNLEKLNKTQGIPFPNDAIIDSLSPAFDRSHDFFNGGFNLKRSTESTQMNFTLNAEMNQIRTSLWGDAGMENEHETFHLLPGFYLDWEYRTGHRINLYYTTSLAQPTMSQLLPIPDNANSLNVFYGNRNLKAEFQNNVFAHWMIFDQFSFTSLFTTLSATYTKDKINWSRVVNENLGQTATLVNVDNDYSARAGVDFSTPIKRLGIKVNAGISENWNRGINIVNGLENTNTNFTHRGNISIENRVKNKWDVSAGGAISLTDANYSLQESLNNQYTNYSYFTEVRFTPNDSWNFFASADVTNYNDKSFGESITVPLISAEISYFFLKNKRASLSLQGADLLNKNKGIQRVSEMNYLRETQTNIIGRYVMISLKYRLNKFGGEGNGIVVKGHR